VQGFKQPGAIITAVYYVHVFRRYAVQCNAKLMFEIATIAPCYLPDDHCTTAYVYIYLKP
jgi:hypothetical protein